MARFLEKQREEIGKSPDELIFKGQQKMDTPVVRLIDFNAEGLTEKTLNSIGELSAYRDADTVTWLNIDGIHDITLMRDVARILDLQQIIIADVLNTQSRPKVQEYENCIYVSIKMLQPESGKITVENISFVFNKNILVSFQEIRGDVFEPVRERIRRGKIRIRSSGTDYLLFTLLDIVIDNYIYIISELGEKIESLEDSLLEEPDQDVLDEINSYKLELNFLRKNIKPAREMIQTLGKMDSAFISEKTEIHFKELQDNINQANESSDSYREVLSDQLNIYHTTISSKLNDVMKLLTIFSVIFIPLTFIAGIYGTNFDVVPELHYPYSYFIMWGIMITIAIMMLIYFRRKNWF